MNSDLNSISRQYIAKTHSNISSNPQTPPSFTDNKKKISVRFIGIGLFALFLLGLFFWFTYFRQQQIKVTGSRQNLSPPLVIEPTKAVGQLVEGFPNFTPYPGSALVYSTVKQAESGPSYEAIWKTTENIDVIVAWYNENLPRDNWVIESAPDVPGTFEQTFIAQKDNLKLYLTIETSESGEETEIIADIISEPTN